MSELITIKPINKLVVNEHNEQAIDVSTKASELIINNQEKYDIASSLLKNIKSMASEIDAKRKSITSPLDEAKKIVMELFKPTYERLSLSEKIVKDKMLKYMEDQEKERLIKQEKLIKEAQAEEERIRKSLEKKAEKALLNGKADKANELLESANAINIVAPVISPLINKVSGISTKKVWKAKVIDENKIPREYLVIDLQKLDKIAKATQGSIKIQGVEFYYETVMAARA